MTTATATATVDLPQRLPALARIQWPDGACLCCAHSTASHGQTACQCYEVAGRGAPVPVLLARQRGGSCGLDAWHHTYQRRAGA